MLDSILHVLTVFLSLWWHMTLDIERRALYNLLRMNWLNDSSMEIEKWQVLDYRSIATQKLFNMLIELSVELDEETFHAYAKDVNSPEEMAALLETEEDSIIWQDQLYLIIFELWRRRLPEKQCFSIFCDELDFQINHYDQESDNQEEIQDLFANLQQLLEDTIDSGEKPEDVFQSLQRYCGNDIETFLNDFISEQVDMESFSYAQELIEGFQSFLPESLWLELFSLRILTYKLPKESPASLKQYIKKLEKAPSLDLYLELLNHMIQNSDPSLFLYVVKQVIPLVQTEEDFQEILEICSDYFKVTDQDEEENQVRILIDSRSSKEMSDVLLADDEGTQELIKILDHSLTVG
jgi:hypothetical protein